MADRCHRDELESSSKIIAICAALLDSRKMTSFGANIHFGVTNDFSVPRAKIISPFDFGAKLASDRFLCDALGRQSFGVEKPFGNESKHFGFGVVMLKLFSSFSVKSVLA